MKKRTLRLGWLVARREHDMTKRPWLLALMFLGGSLFFAPPAQAQRSGFIIGVGLGRGFGSYTSTPSGGSSSTRSTDSGLAVDFHIGGVIGDSFELYYMNKLIFFDPEVVTAIYGVGVTYPLNPDFSISGGIDLTGLGLVAGGGYQLSPRWALHLDLIYEEDNSTVGAQFTINIVSH